MKKTISILTSIFCFIVTFGMIFSLLHPVLAICVSAIIVGFGVWGASEFIFEDEDNKCETSQK